MDAAQNFPTRNQLEVLMKEKKIPGLSMVIFVFQNFELKDKKLSVTLREPFKIIKDTSLAGKCPGMCPAPEHSRTNSSKG